MSRVPIHEHKCFNHERVVLTVCDVCGCGEAEHLHRHGDHVHAHSHALGEPHSHGDQGSIQRSVQLEINVTAKNDRIAAHNRGWFHGRNILALNLVSSPGAGKTTLIERTLRDLATEYPWAVIEGDQQTDNDARRIAACGVPVVQINTGAACHLDAQMVLDASRRLNPLAGTVMLIENVGNLICPALFDLGEAAKVVVASVAEGDDKPEKYPYMFQAASLVILNKCDLLPYVSFDADRFERITHQVNPDASVIRVSATCGDNLDEWYGWLREHRTVSAMAGDL
jgi:hydrogenase nickel incorporation protein HypB